MQLPRGTFSNIKRHTKAGVLLEELQEMKYTGICTISFKSEKGTVVFKSGKCILAQYQEIPGDAAWDELQKIKEEYVDAALSTLDEAQIRLSLEFNKTNRIVKGIRTEISPPEKISLPQQKTIVKTPLSSAARAQTAMIKNYPKPLIPEISASKTSVIADTLHAPELPKIISDIQFRRATQKQSTVTPQKSQIFVQRMEEGEKSEDLASHHTDTDPNNFEMDIDTFETMDVESITNKIRGECKTIIKQLQLEHLTDD